MNSPLAPRSATEDLGSAIRAKLLEKPPVTDAVVSIGDGGRRGTAFVVARAALPVVEVAGELSALFSIAITVRQVSGLPFDADGQLELDRLLTLPVVDREWLNELEQRLRGAAPSVRLDAAPNPSPTPAIHVPATVRSSELHGPELPLRPGEPTVLREVLEHAADHHPAATITFVHQDGARQILSYGSLLAEARGIAAGLMAHGAEPGTPVLLQADTPHDSVRMFWGSVLAGLAPVPLARPKFYDDTDPGAAKLLSVVAQFPACKILATQGAAAPLRSWFQAAGRDPADVIDLGGLDGEGGDALPNAHPEDVAVYLLTSGSTSAPKLVPQTHRRLLDRCAATVIQNGFTEDDVSLNWMPLDHVGGLIMFHLRDVVVGCSQIQVATGWILMQPSRWMELCDEFSATATWAPNFAFNLFNACEGSVVATCWDLSRLRFIMNAGESVVASQVVAFLDLLAPQGLRPNAVLPAWGMSETCSAVLFNSHFTQASARTQGRFVSVGGPLPGISARVVNEHDAVLPEGRKGRLQVRGRCILDGYAYNDPANRSSFTADGWFDTGDLAICERGEIAIVGRQKDVIILNGQNIAGHEIEERLETLPGVGASSAVVVTVRNADDSSDGVVVFLHPTVPEDEHTQLMKRVRSTVVRGFGLQPQAIIFLTPDEIPRTSIGKVQKEQLKQRYLNNMLDHITEPTQSPAGEQQAWRNVYRRTWLRRSARPATIGGPGSLLLVGPESGLEALATSLRLFAPVIACSAGSTELEAALSAASASPESVDTVVFVARLNPAMTSQDADEALQLFRFVKAMSGSGLRPKRLLVLDQLTQSVTGEELEINLAGATQIALLRSLAAETPGLSCRHIDSEAEPAETLARYILEELGDAAAEPEVAYRAGRRFVTRLALELEGAEEQGEALAQDGGFVIVGGLGGIGERLAGKLLNETAGKIVLIGRTPADSLDERRRARLARLEASAPGRVFYIDADTTDGERIGPALDAAAALAARPIDAVFDLATSFTEKALKELSEAEYLSELAVKSRGSWNLYRQAAARDIRRLVAFSSVNGYFGGAGVAGYAAANRFQEALGDLAARRGDRPEVSHFAWSMWDNVGLSEGYALRELTTRKGFEILDPDRGCELALRALQAGKHSLFFGLDAASPAMMPHLHLEAAPYDIVAVSVAEIDRPSLDIERLTDPSGSRLPVGQIVTLGAAAAPALEIPSAGQGDVEDVIARIWGEILELDEVPFDESLFDLGGHSLLVPRMIADLKRDLAIDLTVVDLFTHTTVTELAEFVRQRQFARAG